VDAGGTLSLLGGTVGAEVATVAGTLAGHGTLGADLSCTGTLTGHGFTTGTPGTLQINGDAFFDGTSTTRLLGGAASDQVVVDGDLTLGGSLQIHLAPGTAFGRYPLIHHGGVLQMNPVALSGIPGGTAAHLSASVAGHLDLVIDDSDEDGLPDSWEWEHLGTLVHGPGSDPDGDGQDNATERLTGTDPGDGTSLFAAEIESAAGQLTFGWPSVPGKSYQIQTCDSLGGAWSPVATVPAAPAPAVRTRHTAAVIGGRCFYRVLLQP
jgi:fibronectin-binding autotransporter adhesin